MKHAFLILAHNEFDILKALVRSLDDVGNDIYIHFDRKVNLLPELKMKFSKLYILEDRINVAWGDISVVKAEYKLFERSVENGPYLYYHLLSGVDLPLLAPHKLQAFFREHAGKEFIGFSTYDYSKELSRKVNYVHLFSREFRKTKNTLNYICAGIRALYLRFQIYLGIKRNKNVNFKKGTQWVSITNSFVMELLRQKEYVFSIYRNSFCPDEIYKQTICWNSEFRTKVYCLDDESKGSMRMIGWQDGQLKDWSNDDYLLLMKSCRLFARKFNSNNLEIVNNIIENNI